MDSIGYIFGMTGMFFAIIAWGQIGQLRNDVHCLKEKLTASGALDAEELNNK